MGDSTSISWTDATWNPVRGCSRVSEGCMRCYAESVAARFSGPGQAYEGLADRARKGSKWTGVVRMVPEHLADPLRWKRPRRIFVNSMSDLFHEALTNEQIAAVFGVMAASPHHTFQVLTKRAARMREWFAWVATQHIGDQLMRGAAVCTEATAAYLREHDRDELERFSQASWLATPKPWPSPNVWLGVSVENQDAADERIPELLNTPAAVRFLSCEPLLGPVDLHAIQIPGDRPGLRFSALQHHHDDRFGQSDTILGWVIAGCESGHGARPCHVAWLRSLRDQCDGASVRFFLKQAVELLGGDDNSGDMHQLAVGRGSRRKSGGVIELPYLDGEQHAAFPEANHGQR